MMTSLQINDLNVLEKLNGEETLLVIGGGCHHNGVEYEHGDAIVTGDGKTFRCKEKKNGTFKWKQPFLQGANITVVISP